MSMKEVKRAVKRSKDDFETATLITWKSSGRFDYAAIKTPVGWYTTASERAAFYGVRKIMTFDEILKVLARAEVTDVRVVGVDDGTRIG